MFIAIFAKEFGTGVSRAEKWKVWCSGGEPVNSCCQKGMWLLWKPLKIERKGKINISVRSYRKGCWLGGKRGCVFMDRRNAVWYFHWYMLIVALYFQPLGNDCVTITLELWGWDWLEKAFVFLFTHFLEMKKCSIYFGITLNFKDLEGWSPFCLQPAGLQHLLEIRIWISSEVSSGKEVAGGSFGSGDCLSLWHLWSWTVQPYPEICWNFTSFWSV